jgi:hypothetical protein
VGGFARRELFLRVKMLEAATREIDRPALPVQDLEAACGRGDRPDAGDGEPEEPGVGGSVGGRGAGE